MAKLYKIHWKNTTVYQTHKTFYLGYFRIKVMKCYVTSYRAYTISLIVFFSSSLLFEIIRFLCLPFSSTNIYLLLIQYFPGHKCGLWRQVWQTVFHGLFKHCFLCFQYIKRNGVVRCISNIVGCPLQILLSVFCAKTKKV